MIGTNYIGCIVKILETPKEKIITTTTKKETLMIHVRVLLPQKRRKKTTSIARLIFWGKVASNVLDYYQVNDYLMIEGYLSILKRKNKKSKKIVITVLKVYPLFLNKVGSKN
jgi:single-stranded DNA-binding protein